MKTRCPKLGFRSSGVNTGVYAEGPSRSWKRTESPEENDSRRTTPKANLTSKASTPEDVKPDRSPEGRRSQETQAVQKCATDRSPEGRRSQKTRARRSVQRIAHPKVGAHRRHGRDGGSKTATPKMCTTDRSPEGRRSQKTRAGSAINKHDSDELHVDAHRT